MPTLPAVDFGAAPLDPYPTYASEAGCDLTRKAGTRDLIDRVLRPTFGGVDSEYWVTRQCEVGGASGHKLYRSIDWMREVSIPAEDADVREFIRWLFAPDAAGNAHAMARRLGVMYLIYNRKIWRAYRAAEGWVDYTGPNPHTDHVHISLTPGGALATTSYWTAGVRPTLAETSVTVEAGTLLRLADSPEDAALVRATSAATFVPANAAAGLVVPARAVVLLGGTAAPGDALDLRARPVYGEEYRPAGQAVADAFGRWSYSYRATESVVLAADAVQPDGSVLSSAGLPVTVA